MALTRLLGIATLTSLMLGGCGATPMAPIGVPTREPTLLPNSPVPSATPTPPATGAAIEDFGLITPTDGWVLTTTSLLFTIDRGMHWSDITPTQAKPADALAGDGIKGVVFTDGQNGWVTIAVTRSSPYSATVTLLHTGDAGRHWQPRGSVTTSLDYCLCSATIDALDSLHLWLDIDIGTKADGWGRKILERSTDGGWTWQQVALPTSGQVLFSDSANGVDAGGSPTLATTNVPPTLAPFYTTDDGGGHWHSVTFRLSPPPTPSPGSPNPYVDYAAARGLAIAYVQSVVDASNVYVYAISNGAAWSLVANIAAGGLPVLAAVSPSTWFLSDLGADGTPRLRLTNDAGVSWRSVSPVPEEVPGNTNITFSFAGPSDGWAYTSGNYCLSGKSECGAADILYATANGGVSWTEVPVPGPPPS